MTLTVEQLHFAYSAQQPVLEDISFQVDGGEFVSVLGPNGVGKSTLFRCILGSLDRYSGTIRVDGTDIRQLSQREMSRHIAYIPQTHRPTFGYTVLDTVLMGTTRQLSAFQHPGKAQIELAEQAMERVGIPHLRQRNFAHLSGGGQQLVLVARAIAQQADILVMDEPTSALDYGNQLRILQQVQQLSREGYTVLLSTHNPQHTLTFSDRVLALHKGQLIADGAASEVLTPVLMKTLYGIEVQFLETAAGRVMVPVMGGL